MLYPNGFLFICVQQILIRIHSALRGNITISMIREKKKVMVLIFPKPFGEFGGRRFLHREKYVYAGQIAFCARVLLRGSLRDKRGWLRFWLWLLWLGRRRKQGGL